MARRPGPRIRVSGVAEDDLRAAVAGAFLELGRGTSSEQVDEYIQMERPEIFGPLHAQRGTLARYALYNRLRPGQARPLGRFPSASIGAVAVVYSGQEGTVGHSDVVARRAPGDSDPYWWFPVIDKLQHVSGLNVRQGRDCGTLIAVISSDQEELDGPPIGSVQAWAEARARRLANSDSRF